MSVYLVLYFLLIHLMADAALQTRKQTLSKSKSQVQLLLHVLTVSTIITLGTLFLRFSMLPNPTFGFEPTYSYEWLRFVILFVSTFVTHYVIDKYMGVVTSYFWDTENRYDFFVSVQIDKFLHILILFVTLDLLFFNTF